MAGSADDKSKYRSVKPDTAPKTDEGKSLIDLYVHLPSNKKFVKWVHKGDPLNAEHVDKIKDHVDPNFYTEEAVEEMIDNGGPMREPKDDIKIFKAEPRSKDDIKIFENTTAGYESARLVVTPHLKPSRDSGEVGAKALGQIHHLESIQELFGNHRAEELAEPIDDELKIIFAEIGGSNPGSFTLQDSKLEALSERLCSVVSPEVGDVRGHLKNIPAFVTIMDESAAISTLAILFAIAQGQKARGVFKDLSYACLLMDISLVGVTPELKHLWIANPDQLSENEHREFESHPRKSQAIVMEKFKNIPEIVGQMILGHHELFNGRGYPRKVRSDLLPPIVRVLAFAVDVHFQMKKAALDGDQIDIETVIEYFMDPKVEPHLRRHNIELCRKILKYTLEGEPV